MKINNITAQDYAAQDGFLELIGLTGSSLEEITSMDTTLVKVQTDDGDLVEAFAGYTLRTVTYEVASETYTAVLALGTADTTAATLARLAEDLDASQQQVAALQQANVTLTAQLTAISDAIERGLTL